MRYLFLEISLLGIWEMLSSDDKHHFHLSLYYETSPVREMEINEHRSSGRPPLPRAPHLLHTPTLRQWVPASATGETCTG